MILKSLKTFDHSNVAILAGEFAKPAEEEEDDFDAAFDALAQVKALTIKISLDQTKIYGLYWPFFY
jgi:hypothetical protein